MAIFKNLFGIREIKSPVFYKEFKEESKELNSLLELKDKVKSNKIKYIERDIKFLSSVIEGEKNIYFQLMKSSVPMICLYDIKIKSDDYIAQLDFILITTNFIMILESKKLNGDIYIDEEGNFTRYIKDRQGKILDREDIYSPILQNDKNVRIIRDLLIEAGIIKTLPIISSVIISNDESNINRSKAPKKIKYDIFRCSELIDLLDRKTHCYSKEKKMFEKHMKKIAEFLIENNNEINYDYAKKYNLTEFDFIEYNLEEKSIIENTLDNIKNRTTGQNTKAKVVKKVKSYDELVTDLKNYRESKSKEDNIKPHFIYNDKMIEDIIELNPDNKKKLIQIVGFGPTKIDKYGEDIINILKG